MHLLRLYSNPHASSKYIRVSVIASLQFSYNLSPPSLPRATNSLSYSRWRLATSLGCTFFNTLPLNTPLSILIVRVSPSFPHPVSTCAAHEGLLDLPCVRPVHPRYAPLTINTLIPCFDGPPRMTVWRWFWSAYNTLPQWWNLMSAV